AAEGRGVCGSRGLLPAHRLRFAATLRHPLPQAGEGKKVSLPSGLVSALQCGLHTSRVRHRPSLAGIGPAGRLRGTTRENTMFRRFTLGAATAVALMATPAYAVTELQWWHAMTGGNNDVIVKLANDFNASQSDYKIVPTFKGGYADTLNAGIAAFRAGNAPGIMQVFEVGTATMMAAKGAVKPVSELMKEQGEKFDPQSYLPAITGYYSTSKGEMLSFPFNSSSMVLWANLDALKKADIAEPPKTWRELFADAKKLHATSPSCGFSSSWITWGLIEQFSAWHNVPIG